MRLPPLRDLLRTAMLVFQEGEVVEEHLREGLFELLVELFALTIIPQPLGAFRPILSG